MVSSPKICFMGSYLYHKKLLPQAVQNMVLLKSRFSGPRHYKDKDISAMNNNTTQLQAWDKQYVWHPFTQMQDWQADDPIVIVAGGGGGVVCFCGEHSLVD